MLEPGGHTAAALPGQAMAEAAPPAAPGMLPLGGVPAAGKAGTAASREQQTSRLAFT